MQGNVPKQSTPEKEKKKKKTSVGLTAIAFTKVCTCRVLNYSGFFSQVQFKEFMINPLSTYFVVPINPNWHEAGRIYPPYNF